VLTFVLVKNSADEQSAGTTYTIDGSGEVTLGRSPKADVQILSPNLSRTHFRLVPTIQGWSLEDLGSKNGCKLNGASIIGAQPLRSGDSIQAGDCYFEIAGISAPINGPKQINVTSLGDQVSIAPPRLAQKFAPQAAPAEEAPVPKPVAPAVETPSPKPIPPRVKPRKRVIHVDEDDAMLLSREKLIAQADEKLAEPEPVNDLEALLLGSGMSSKSGSYIAAIDGADVLPMPPSDLKSPVSKGPPDRLDSPADASVDASGDFSDDLDAGSITSEPETRPINAPPTPAPATPEPAEQAGPIDEDDFMAELEDLLGS
jgi:hypothetical protein